MISRLYKRAQSIKNTNKADTHAMHNSSFTAPAPAPAPAPPLTPTPAPTLASVPTLVQSKPIESLSASPSRAESLAREGLNELSGKDLFRVRRIAQSPTQTQQKFDGQEFSSFCSNDYLGLASDPLLTEALLEGAKLWGVGSGASHLISGHTQAHQALEDRLATWMSPHIPQAQALLFSSGYAANLSLMGALSELVHVRMGPAEEETPRSSEHSTGVSIYSASLNHASIIDGIRLARQLRPVSLHVFDTDFLDQLESRLATDVNTLKIIVIDAVFSMDGHMAPVKSLLALADRFEALLVLDDAHGFGVLGEQGHGILEHLGVSSGRIVYMGTLGKAVGVSGAFVCAPATLCEWIFQKSRPYIYSTASPPALAHATLQSLAVIESAEGHRRRAQLQHLIEHWRAKARFRHWQLAPSLTPIQPLIVGSAQDALLASSLLKNWGYLIPAIRPPTVEDGKSRLRITFCAKHSLADVDRLIEHLQRAEQSVSVSAQKV